MRNMKKIHDGLGSCVMVVVEVKVLENFDWGTFVGKDEDFIDFGFDIG